MGRDITDVDEIPMMTTTTMTTSTVNFKVENFQIQTFKCSCSKSSFIYKELIWSTVFSSISILLFTWLDYICSCTCTMHYALLHYVPIQFQLNSIEFILFINMFDASNTKTSFVPNVVYTMFCCIFNVMIM